ncbi:MAG: hypothetical protein IT369_18665 [Candidatus Latescibacteria bacterium]|nr:hypothetical protein [Candidatus Latescibacterota bacterium]
MAVAQAQQGGELPARGGRVAAQASQQVEDEFVGGAEVRVVEYGVVPGHWLPPLGVALG